MRYAHYFIKTVYIEEITTIERMVHLEKSGFHLTVAVKNSDRKTLQLNLINDASYAAGLIMLCDSALIPFDGKLCNYIIL